MEINTRLLQKADNYLNSISIEEYDEALEDAGINKNNFDLKNNKTICELVEETLQLTNDEQIINNLLEIKEKAGKMEDRLLKYCNSIEDLGFKRIGRDYENQ